MCMSSLYTISIVVITIAATGVALLDSPTPVESSTSSSERISWCLEDPLAPSDSCGVAARAVQEQCSGVLGNPLTLSDSCGSVARAVPSVLTGGACRTKVVPLW
ncbi:hypothetical protein NDU88_012170 [Pleurodeles waltl]|uniref:Uncharacterized protein n=1 Tax=Pleurodeles waltl TaxID=8319 RepID=A0AAV7QZE4_PLEWA|nr:hypothetical protein NDU88_012170 [Pleurodeles waltl]